MPAAGSLLAQRLGTAFLLQHSHAFPGAVLLCPRLLHLCLRVRGTAYHCRAGASVPALLLSYLSGRMGEFVNDGVGGKTVPPAPAPG